MAIKTPGTESPRSAAILLFPQPALQLIYDTAPIGLACLSPDCRYLQINERLTGICGISVEDHLGRSVRDCVPALAASVEQIVASIMATGEPIVDIEVSGQRADQFGERFWMTHWYPLRAPDGEIVAINVAAEEITERKRLFNELQTRTRELTRSLEDLRTMQDRLIQREKLASLGQLTAGIAHELENPLNFINNFASISTELTDELDDLFTSAEIADKTRGEIKELTDLLKTNLQRIVHHGKRADSIIKNMLLHSREGSQERRPADVNALVNEGLNLAWREARTKNPSFNVTVKRDLDPEAGMIDAFPQDIMRAILNLALNGLYAATERRRQYGENFEPLLSARTRSRGEHVEIAIRDNGIGIAHDIKAKIFNPFFTTKPAGEGTGLGLSMSHDIIVKQHGGTIEVETEPGEFAEFTVVLPRTGILLDCEI
ncbi:sensor histidine kinase [Bradyrhizobium sp. CCGUVB4N]|uniref:sensor histidine kinase n=1 Tax=Bradyrhizobium sp. CCGUVB4N TaxID=2949631 RepID=UPI00211496C7|nr:ATP-binding protein [Bradyrhizobium sp. CCGUVB4N]